MEEISNYIVNLNTLQEGIHQYTFRLDDAFFAATEQDEILGGEVTAEVAITARSSGFVLQLSVEGEVTITCDRCLDPMKQPVEGEETLLVKLSAAQPEGDDDTICVDPEDGTLDLGWLLYELTELSLPIVHSHQEGACNPQMQELLRTHLCTIEAEEENIE